MRSIETKWYIIVYINQSNGDVIVVWNRDVFTKLIRCICFKVRVDLVMFSVIWCSCHWDVSLCNHFKVFVTYWRCRRPEGDLRMIHMQPQYDVWCWRPSGVCFKHAKKFGCDLCVLAMSRDLKISMETFWRPNRDLLACMELYWRCEICQDRHQVAIPNI